MDWIILFSALAAVGLIALLSLMLVRGGTLFNYRVLTKKNDTSAALDFISVMEACVKNGKVGLDFGKGHIELDSDIYENFLCDGPYTMLNEAKAHKFFAGVRGWIDFRRGLYNGENDGDLKSIGSERVTFVIRASNEEPHLVGFEEPKKLVIDVYNKDPLPTSPLQGEE